MNRPRRKPLRGLCRFALLLAVLSCAILPHATAVRASSGEVVCRVDAARRLGEVPRGLFGTNVEWFHNANGLWDPAGGLNLGLVQLAKRQGVTVVRFPGGILSDFYHWRDGVGPRVRRPARPHGTDKGVSANVFGTPELMTLCRNIGAEPLLTVNVGSGTPEEAAAWVTYCNAAVDPERARDGFPKPFAVRYWEIGNELYLDGSPVEKSLSLRPEVYTRRFLEYARAMRAADPNITLLAIVRANAYSVPFGPYPEWNETLLGGAAQAIDAVAVHNAYFPSLLARENPSPREAYMAMWAAPEAVARDLEGLDALLARYERQRRITIAITEWGPLFSATDPVWLDHVKTQGSAVYVARMLQVMLEHPRVTLATYFKFSDATFMGWVTPGRGPKASYQALRLFSRHFGSRLVDVAVSGSPRFSVPRTGYVPPLTDVPEVTAVASLNDEGNVLFVNLVNRAWDTTQKMRLDIAGFAPQPEYVRHELASADATAHNGPDLPSWWPYRKVEPGPARPGGREIDIVSVREHGLESVTLPPHSIVTLELRSTREGPRREALQ